VPLLPYDCAIATALLVPPALLLRLPEGGKGRAAGVEL
jgi:hypothetical protein